MSNAVAAPIPQGDGATLTLQSLQAQIALLPQALGVFAVSLPLFVWAGSYASNAVYMAASFAIFAINWGAFYTVVNWLKRPQAENTGLRLRVQTLGGLLWAGAVAQIAAFGAGAGPASDAILMMSVAAAVICVFFATPSLPLLLIVAPAAMAGPLVALFLRPHGRDAAELAWGAFALAFMLALIMNRNLRRQFDLAADRERLSQERAHSLAQAEKLAGSKSDLVATLSHEIRNGLTGVAHVLAAAAGQNGRAAPSREQLGAALAAANDLIAVLNATLDSETAEAGRLLVDAAPFDPVRLIRDLATLIRPQALARGLEFSVYIEPELEGRRTGAAMADAARVRQVLANLLGNAVKYTVRGRIEARVERRDGALSIAIADTGPGLTPEELALAFEPFKRVPRTGAGIPGAGLGLSLSRQLVRLMGATLTADSAVGVGSCFTLELPYDSAALIDSDGQADDTDAPDAPHGLRVLIAEDDGLNAAMLRTILEQLGHRVVHAQNGRRALELARVCEFDLIMLDGRMPEMDGHETAAAIRRLDGPCRNAAIVAVIGGDADEARECLDAGADCVMRKPVTVSGVARAVADAAGRKPAEATTAAA